MKSVLNVILLLMVVSGIISLEACGDDDDKPKSELEKLPAATQEGKGTFGCLVNGKAWVTETTVDTWSFYQEQVLSITAVLEISERDEGVAFGLIGVDLKEETYQLFEYPYNFGQFGNESANCSYLTDSDHTGSLNITHYDDVNFIISGTFEFEAYSDDCSESIKVTNGRFDLHYAP